MMDVGIVMGIRTVQIIRIRLMLPGQPPGGMGVRPVFCQLEHGISLLIHWCGPQSVLAMFPRLSMSPKD